MRVLRQNTRYKGVWDSGYTSGLEEAGRILREFVTAGGEFSATAGSAWDRNTLLLRLGDWIADPDGYSIIKGMEGLMRRDG